MLQREKTINEIYLYLKELETEYRTKNEDFKIKNTFDKFTKSEILDLYNKWFDRLIDEERDNILSNI